jgi:hypothetical protein
MKTVEREAATKRGIRMAAQVATVLALGAAGAALSNDARASDADRASSGESAARLGDLIKVQGRGGNCGCAPCWGPPAPPASGEFSDEEAA